MMTWCLEGGLEGGIDEEECCTVLRCGWCVQCRPCHHDAEEDVKIFTVVSIICWLK